MKKDSEEKTLKCGAAKSPSGAAVEAEEPANDWESDQKKRSYYYDDAHGYEIYDPETDEEDEED